MGTIQNIPKIADDSPLGELAVLPVVTNPDVKVAELVIEDIRDARRSLVQAMKTCDRYGSMTAHRLIGHRVVEIDDLLDALQRAPEGVTR